jgi:hypothetical protein
MDPLSAHLKRYDLPTKVAAPDSKIFEEAHRTERFISQIQPSAPKFRIRQPCRKLH